MRTVSDKRRTENHNTHFTFSNRFQKNLAIYGIMWKNVVQPEKPQMTVWPMSISRWVPKTTNTQSQYLICVAFLLNDGYMNVPQCYFIHTRLSCNFFEIEG